MATGIPDVRITQVYPDSPASRIGLREGDVVRTLDWQAVRSPEHFRQLLRSARDRHGTAVVQVLRAGSTVTFEIPLSGP